jgi:tetratricopeptide (TPR) repeat protein
LGFSKTQRMVGRSLNDCKTNFREFAGFSASLSELPALPNPSQIVSLLPMPRRAHWAAVVALVGLTIAAYQPSLRNGFIWDDDDHFVKNPAMSAPDGLRKIWSSLAVSRYYPLTLTTFWVQRRLWGLNPMPYHAVNIALHAANAMLLFLLLRRLDVRGAWVAAALWAMHPVNVESVAWVTELKNVQSGVFFFLALLCYLQFEQQIRPSWYAAALVCFAAALTSKPSTVIFPLVLLLCAAWQRRHLSWTDILRSVPFLLLSVGMSLLTIAEQKRHIEGDTQEWSLTIAQRLMIAVMDLWFYLGKLLWPVDLTFVYPRWSTQPDALSLILPLGGLVAASIFLWRHRERLWARAGMFGFGYFAVALLPVLGFVNVYYFRYSFVADHFQYLASIGPLALAVSCTATFLRRRIFQNSAAAVVLAGLAAVSARRCEVFAKSETLWRDTIKRNPGCWMALTNLGAVEFDAGRTDQAMELYERALSLNPQSVEAHVNKGLALARIGKAEEAMAEYERALRIWPNSVEAHNSLGVALVQTGKVTEAIEHYEQALRINADYLPTHNNLGLALVQAGRAGEAIEHYEQALRIEPNNSQVHNNLGQALVQVRKVPAAIQHYRQALEIKPNDAEIHNNLGNALFYAGNVTDAIGQYEQALRINPKYPEARSNLGYALFQTGSLTNAINSLEEALRLKPDYADAHYNLGIVLSKSGRTSAAIDHFEQTLRINPSYAQAHYNLANALSKTGRPADAIEHYRAVIKTNPEFLEARLGLADAFAATGQFDEANHTAREALQLAARSNQTNLVEQLEARLQTYADRQAR